VLVLKRSNNFLAVVYIGDAFMFSMPKVFIFGLSLITGVFLSNPIFAMKGGGPNAAAQQPEAPLPQNAAPQPAAQISAEVQSAIDAIRHATGEIDIDLSGKVKTDAEIAAIAGALQEVRYPIRINLDRNDLNDEQAIMISTALEGSRFPIYLSLDSNYITGVGANFLANLFLTSQAEVSLNLAHNDIDNAGAIQIARGMQGSKYPAGVDLTNNKASGDWGEDAALGELSDEVAFEFAKVIKGAKQKRVINLLGNYNIRSKGIIALLDAIKDADAPITLGTIYTELEEYISKEDRETHVAAINAIRFAKHPLTLYGLQDFLITLDSFDYERVVVRMWAARDFLNAILEAKNPIKLLGFIANTEDEKMVSRILAEGISKRPFMPSIVGSAEYMGPYYHKELDRLAAIIRALPPTIPLAAIATIISHECIYKDTPEERRRLRLFTDKVCARMDKLIEKKEGKARSETGLAIMPSSQEKSDGSLPPPNIKAHAGAGSPQVFAMRDRWYDDDDINRLMDALFDNVPRLTPTHALNINADGGEIFRANLMAREENIRRGVERIDRILIPVNLGAYDPAAGIAGTHWAGLRINRAQTAEGRAQIRYFDPLGNEMPDRLRAILNEVYPNAEIIVNRQRFQFDGCNCGPWVIEIFEHLERYGDFPAIAMRDIRTVRNGQRRILAAPGPIGTQGPSAPSGSVVTTVTGSGNRMAVNPILPGGTAPRLTASIFGSQPAKHIERRNSF
jgi:hypothetical protein